VTGTLPATNGGTGIASYAVGDILYANTTTTLAKLADVATGQLIKSGGVGVAPSWGGFSATGDATGTYGASGLPLTLATVNGNVGTFASVTVNGKGLVTAATALSGDATTSGAALTLATVNSNVDTFGSATQVAQVTVNAKGLTTAVSNVTVTPAASSITGAGDLTKTDDTNVTLTLGGTPTGSLLKSVSLTLGWTSTLAVSRGGSGAGTFTNHGILLGQGTSAFAATAVMTDGQLLVGQSSADPIPKTITGDVTFTAAGASAVAKIAGTTVSGTTGTGNVAFSATPTFTGTLNCAAITPTGLVDISGSSAGQIKFPATQNASSNANTLDDYEEGTWTVSDQSGASLSFTGVDCTYVKIGQFVFGRAFFTYPATANTNVAKLGGLPFTVTGFSSALVQTNTATVNLMIQVTDGTTLMDVYIAGATQQQNNVFSGKYFITNLVYRASA
jgi:hypothetical protein